MLRSDESSPSLATQQVYPAGSAVGTGNPSLAVGSGADGVFVHPGFRSGAVHWSRVFPARGYHLQ